MNEPPQNVTRWCDGLRLNRFHVALLILSGLTLIFDGYDTQIVSYVMPSIMKEWHLSPVKLGSLASYSWFGYLIGGIGFGMMADRVGRKKSLILAVLVFSTFSGVCYFAPNFFVLCILRFLAGLGMGGAQPVSITLVAEYAPARIRGKAITVAGSLTLGWVLAGLVSMAVIPVFGWRMVLLMGFLPVILVPFLAWYMPESLRFLLSKGRYDDAVREIRKVEKAARVAPFNWTEKTLVAPTVEGRGSARDLLSPSLIVMTVLVWMTYIITIMTNGAINTWVPTLLIKSGFSMVRSFGYSAAQSLGAAVGAFAIGIAMDRFGRKAGLIMAYILGGMSLWLFGNVHSYFVLFVAGTAVGFFQLATTPCLNVVTGEIYPTRIRSTALAIALAFGRIGAIAAPVLGGLLQMAGLTTRGFFMAFSVPPVVCALLVLMYRVNVKGQALETVTARLAAKQ